ncbi:Uncharacterized protein TCM_012385 [Theobroma cacao]|uniref:Uncharacterized protein n=1 Tax=Theobroma cacao TaxID=3641 RepID=A0A061FU91_THECC|nr:Uncharacterized protein TCM_012385 [Theobroma cacao]
MQIHQDHRSRKDIKDFEGFHNQMDSMKEANRVTHELAKFVKDLEEGWIIWRDVANLAGTVQKEAHEDTESSFLGYGLRKVSTIATNAAGSLRSQDLKEDFKCTKPSRFVS